MTLEDFFTLTEIKDGLAATSRVEELVTIMQKDKDCVVKNVGDATRQWAAVASTIAATKNKDCLDLFIQLDGLWYIDRWLKDAQKFGNDSTDSIIEEAIIAILRALENLHIDIERSISSGIWMTVKNLLGHCSSPVQDIASALFDGWKQQDGVSDSVQCDTESSGAHRDHGTRAVAMISGESSRPGCSVVDVPLSSQNSKGESLTEEVPKAENLPLRNSEDLKSGGGDVQIQTHKNEHSDMILDRRDMEDRAPDHLPSSLLSNSVHENPSVKAKYSVSTAVETSPVVTGSFQITKQGCVEGQADAPRSDDFSKDEKQVCNPSSSSDKMGLAASPSIMERGAVFSGADVASSQDIKMEPALQNNVSASEVRPPTCEPNSGTDDMGVPNSCNDEVFKMTGQDGKSRSDTLQDLSGNERIYGKREDLETSLSRMEDIEAVDKDKEHMNTDRGEDFRNASHFSRPAIDNRSSGPIDKRTTDIELEYGMVDALEVARKVAQEVEREVVDYREPSCSSSEKISGGIRQAGSPDSINGKQDLSAETPQKEVPAGQNLSSEAYPEGEGHVINSGNLETEPENCINDMESSQVTEAAQEPEVNPEKSLCDFDLNQEVHSDDMDHTVSSISTPIPVVSASRPLGAPGLPVAPLQFEGALGWKGSTPTSAFRPASPHKLFGEKALPAGGIGNSSKPRPGGLDIDLNVAEGGDDKLVDLFSGKQIPVSSGLQSAESSLDVSPRRSERPKLDLNRISDDGDTPSDLRMERRIFYNRNGHRSPSPASSSSSMQPSLRNIDLNDRPHVHIDSSDQGPYHGRYQNITAFGAPKSDEPVISIMGTKVEVNRKDFFPQASSLQNGKPLEPALDASMARAGGVLGLGPAMSYTHSPVFGYNGLTAAPSLSYSSAMYGPGSSIPYMVDSRGAPVVPQIVGSASSVPPSYSQPPFILSMSSTPLGLNSGPSRPSFDLNSGFTVEGGNRDLSLRPLFMPGQGRSMEEPLRINLQPSSSSGVGGKRKEPEGGWEPYPFYRHQQPPWK